MLQIVKENPKAAAAALAMHLAIILFLIVGVDWLETPKPVESGVEVVQARVVDQALVTAELEKLQQAETDRELAVAAAREREERELEDLRSQQLAEQQRLEELARQRRLEERNRDAEAEKQRQIEQQRELEEQRLAVVKAKRLAEEEKRKQAEAKQLAEQKKREAEKAALAIEEKKREEEEKKRKAEEERKRKAELEQQRKAEAARKAEEEKKRKAEAARKAEEEKKRQAEAARKAREAELEAAMQAEHDARVRDRFMLQIQQRVINNWVRLDGTGEGLKCKLRVRLAKGGSVLAVSVIESSGSGAFDRSAEAAVYKADPLPVPEDSLFEQFRDIIFVFDPNR